VRVSRDWFWFWLSLVVKVAQPVTEQNKGKLKKTRITVDNQLKATLYNDLVDVFLSAYVHLRSR
jgi:hypothetical protein